jgi:hypothetical protein
MGVLMSNDPAIEPLLLRAKEAARNALKQSKGNIPKGSNDKNGNIEAWD